MKQLIIGIDVDGTVADLHTEWLKRYNREYKDTLEVKDWDTWDITTKIKKECGNKIFNYLLDPDLYDIVKPIQDSAQGVMIIRNEGHKILFISTCVPGTEKPKIDWLKRYGYIKSDKEFFSTGEKQYIAVDVLIDDRPATLHALSKTTLPVLVTQPYNMTENFLRLNNWKPETVNTLLEHVRAIKDPTILEEANSLVNSTRQKDYGHPHDDYTKVAKFWQIILANKLRPDVIIEPEEAAMCMIGIKLSRQMNRHKRDNLVDIAGYAQVVDKIMERKKND